MQPFKQFLTENQADLRFHFLKPNEHFHFKGDVHTWMKVDDKRGMNKTDIRGPQIYKVQRLAKVERAEDPTLKETLLYKVKKLLGKGIECKSCNGFGNAWGHIKRLGPSDTKTTCQSCKGTGLREELNPDEPIKKPINLGLRRPGFHMNPISYIDKALNEKGFKRHGGTSKHIFHHETKGQIHVFQNSWKHIHKGLVHKDSPNKSEIPTYLNSIKEEILIEQDKHIQLGCKNCKQETSHLKLATSGVKDGRIVSVTPSAICRMCGSHRLIKGNSDHLDEGVILAKALKMIGLGKHERYRKSIKILPGLKVNFSKSGHSITAGIPHASVTWSKRGRRTTVGVPRTGVYYQWNKGKPKSKVKK